MDVYVIEGDGLLVGRPKGMLTASLAMEIIEFVEVREEWEAGTGFNRFCDLSNLAGISLSLDEINQMAVRRRAFNPDAAQVKSAFLAPEPVTYTAARVYEILLQSPRIEVRVFSSLKEAAAWLGVEPKKLVPAAASTEGPSQRPSRLEKLQGASLKSHFYEKEGLLIGRPEGVFDAALARDIVEFVELQESQAASGFNRYCDLTRLQGINLMLADIEELTAQRRASTHSMAPAKSAFLISGPLGHGLAHLYKALLAGSPLEIQLFEMPGDAAQWLGVDPEKLKL